MGIEDIKAIRKEIKDKDFQWSAGETSLSELSKEEKKKYLGLVIEEDEIKKMEAALVEEDALAASEGIGYVYPRRWDWRNVYERNWTTPVKDQGGCPTCVAFAVVGAIESNLKIFKCKPLSYPNLSEADLVMGGGKDVCKYGWNFPPALEYAKNRGIPDEACFPYPTHHTGKPCPDRDKRVIKIQNWQTLCNVSRVKEWICRRGPLVTAMEVYYDFFYYRGGIYKHTWGEFSGLHAVLVVGYNDQERYWICKNSWGEGWGERKGWFRIAYNQCGIGTRFCFWTVEFPLLKDDIYIPVSGKVTAKFLSRAADFDNEFLLPQLGSQKEVLFKATNSNVGNTYNVRTEPFKKGQRLVFALRTPEKFTYYTDPSKNADCCDHVIKTQVGPLSWDLKWEDLYGLGDKDYDDVVVRIEVTP